MGLTDRDGDITAVTRKPLHNYYLTQLLKPLSSLAGGRRFRNRADKTRVGRDTETDVYVQWAGRRGRGRILPKERPSVGSTRLGPDPGTLAPRGCDRRCAGHRQVSLRRLQSDVWNHTGDPVHLTPLPCLPVIPNPLLVGGTVSWPKMFGSEEGVGEPSRPVGRSKDPGDGFRQ